jgi:hypothetical protein
MGSIYDGQADRAICEFCDLATRSCDPTSESLKPIQSARAEHDPSHRSLATCEVLRGFAYSAARARDDDDLVFDARHEVLLSSLAALLRPEFAFQAHCNEHPPRTTGD